MATQPAKYEEIVAQNEYQKNAARFERSSVFCFSMMKAFDETGLAGRKKPLA
jgi:hypothetical protein